VTTWAIVVAAGEGTRIAAGAPKALLPLAGRPMLAWSLDAVLASESIDGVVVVCGESWRDEGERLVRSIAGPRVPVCAGGRSRHASVRNGLEQIGADADRVVVHDAARPLAGPELFERALAALDRASAGICAIPVTDTIKRASGDAVIETVDRSALWRAQTPQAFRLADLLEAAAAGDGDAMTDEAALLERAGMTVIVVPGDERNIKITTPADLSIAEDLLRGRRT